MVRAWFMDKTDKDQRTPHMPDQPQFVDLDQLQKDLGVMYWKVDVDRIEEEGLLAKIKKERGYSYEDEIKVDQNMPGYETKIKAFFEEHLHSDEEIRLCCDGSGYFDVRNKEDQWIRIELNKGDMITLPAGIYHRFTLDVNDYIKARRFFIGEPVWTPINRPADEHPARKGYLKTYG